VAAQEHEVGELTRACHHAMGTDGTRHTIMYSRRRIGSIYANRQVITSSKAAAARQPASQAVGGKRMPPKKVSCTPKVSPSAVHPLPTSSDSQGTARHYQPFLTRHHAYPHKTSLDTLRQRCALAPLPRPDPPRPMSLLSESAACCANMRAAEADMTAMQTVRCLRRREMPARTRQNR